MSIPERLGAALSGSEGQCTKDPGPEGRNPCRCGDLCYVVCRIAADAGTLWLREPMARAHRFACKAAAAVPHEGGSAFRSRSTWPGCHSNPPVPDYYLSFSTEGGPETFGGHNPD